MFVRGKFLALFTKQILEELLKEQVFKQHVHLIVVKHVQFMTNMAT